MDFKYYSTVENKLNFSHCYNSVTLFYLHLDWCFFEVSAWLGVLGCGTVSWGQADLWQLLKEGAEHVDLSWKFRERISGRHSLVLARRYSSDIILFSMGFFGTAIPKSQVYTIATAVWKGKTLKGISIVYCSEVSEWTMEHKTTKYCVPYRADCNSSNTFEGPRIKKDPIEKTRSFRKAHFCVSIY